MGAEVGSGGEIEILGQRIVLPRGASEVVALVAIVAGIVACVYFVVVEGKRDNLHAVRGWWTSASVDTSGATTPFRGRKLLQFWTPSLRTKESTDAKPWEKLATEETIHGFGAVLKSDSRVLGFRRQEVFGHGRTKSKWGWWWSVTVAHDYQPDDLLKVYSEYWKIRESIYVEITSNDAEYRGPDREP